MVCDLTGRVMYGSYVAIPANFGLLYVTCRLIFLITVSRCSYSHAYFCL